MEDWKEYQKTKLTEMRPVTSDDILNYETFGRIEADNKNNVSISDEDIKNGSPKEGDMIARDPQNHNDQWLVSAEYFNGSFEQVGYD